MIDDRILIVGWLPHTLILREGKLFPVNLIPTNLNVITKVSLSRLPPNSSDHLNAIFSLLIINDQIIPSPFCLLFCPRVIGLREGLLERPHWCQLRILGDSDGCYYNCGILYSKPLNSGWRKKERKNSRQKRWKYKLSLPSVGKFIQLYTMEIAHVVTNWKVPTCTQEQESYVLALEAWLFQSLLMLWRLYSSVRLIGDSILMVVSKAVPLIVLSPL